MDGYSANQRRKIILLKKNVVKKVLFTDGVTYDIAKAVLGSLESDLIRSGEEYLLQTQVKTLPLGDRGSEELHVCANYEAAIEESQARVDSCMRDAQFQQQCAKEFGFEVVTEGRFTDEGFDITSVVIRLNSIAMNEWTDSGLLNCREVYETREEWEKYKADKKVNNSVCQ